MITILKGKEITVEWKVVSLDTKQPVDFEGVNAKVFLLAPDNIYTLPFDVVRDDFRGLRMNIPTSYISTGVYDLKVIWLKDALKDKPVYRNVSVKREAFALTDEASEVTYEGDTIKIATGVESCGRDGMSAYEIAVFRGFAKESSEKEWVESLDNVLASEASRVKAEKERVKAEDERVKGEDLRIRIFTNGEEDRRQSFEISQSSRTDAFNYSEAQRQSIFESKEAQRDNNENSRMVKEEQRKIAETSRKSNEQGRETAESGRVSAESTRVADENIRKANEQGRVDAEKNRVNAETSRANAEVARVNTENTRKSNEQGRVSAENGRVSAEAAREAAEVVREATFQANEAIREENETSRQDAEVIREENEKRREEAETIRESTFQTNEAAREAEFGKAIQAAKDNLVVVNDLTTGGEERALSAEMGKELAREATTEHKGLMSAEDKAHLDNIYNLFLDKGAYLNYLGIEKPDTFGLFVVTNYLPINKEVGITLKIEYLSKYTAVEPLCFYDKNKKFISVLPRNLYKNKEQVTYLSEIPESAVFFRLVSTKAYAESSYVDSRFTFSIFQSLNSIEKEVMELYDKPEIEWTLGTINASGIFTATSNIYTKASEFIELLGDFSIKMTSTGAYYNACTYNSDKEFVRVVYSFNDYNATTPKGQYVNVERRDDEVYLRVGYYDNPNTAGDNFDMFYITHVNQRKVTYDKYITEREMITSDVAALKSKTSENLMPANVIPTQLGNVTYHTQQVDVSEYIGGQFYPKATRYIFKVNDPTVATTFTPWFICGQETLLPYNSKVTYDALLRFSSNVLNVTFKQYNFGEFKLGDTLTKSDTDFILYTSKGTLTESTANKQLGYRIYSVIPTGIESFYIDILNISCTVDVPSDGSPYLNKQKEDLVTKSYLETLLGGTANNNNIGFGLQRLYAKLWSKMYGWDDMYKQRTIRIVSFADSIGNSIGEQRMKNVFSASFPNITFEWKFINYGGSSASHMLPQAKEAIMFNPDLVIIGEWETYKYDMSEQQPLDALIMLFKEYTGADIALWAHSFRRSSAELLVAQDVQGYLESYTHRIRCMMMAYAKKYGCEFMDLQKPIITKLLIGEWSVNDVFATSTDAVHPSTATINVFMEEMSKHFAPMYGNEQIANNNVSSLSQTTRMFAEAKALQDLSFVKMTGDAEFATTDLDRSGNLLVCSTGSTLEFDINNACGCEITTFGSHAGKYRVEINGEFARNILLDWAGCVGADDGQEVIFDRIHKAVITKNVIISGDYLPFKIVVTSIDFSQGSIGYDLYQSTTKIGSGDISSDCTFSFNDGEILIPQYYGFIRNYRTGEYDTNYPAPDNVSAIEAGDEFEFIVHRGTYDEVIVDNNNLTQFNNLVGLRKGNYKIKLTVTEGTVAFDSMMIL